MEILVNTKYNIGDKCYTCKSSSHFKNGKFTIVYEPCEDPGVITSIISYIDSNKDISLSYVFNTKFTEPINENLVFSTYEECQKYCDAINEQVI